MILNYYIWGVHPGSRNLFTAPKEGKWIKTHNIDRSSGHSSWASPHGVLLIGANEDKSTALLTKEGEQGDPCEHCEHLGGYLDVKASFNLDLDHG